jgi:hypothetical protein
MQQKKLFRLCVCVCVCVCVCNKWHGNWTVSQAEYRNALLEHNILNIWIRKLPFFKIYLLKKDKNVSFQLDYFMTKDT